MAKSFSVWLSCFLGISGWLSADCMDECCCQDTGCSSFYLKYGSGASVSRKAHVKAPLAIWDEAVQGYNADLGARPIFNAGLGYEFGPIFSTDLLLSYRPHFTYKKFQTGIQNGVQGFLGDKTRRFHLDVLSLMGTAYVSGHGFDCLNWSVGCDCGEFYPLLGVGAGVSRMQIFDFRSTGLPAVDPDVYTSPGFGSENEYLVRYRFTYQVMAGLEYRFNDRWAISTGYRWFDAGRFKGPRYLREPSGIAFDVGGDEWRMNFSAHEWFIELKVLLY